MSTIQVVWKNGVFTPVDAPDLEEGTRLELQIVAVESEACPPPFDLPMPAGGQVVTARNRRLPLPDAHDITE